MIALLGNREIALGEVYHSAHSHVQCQAFSSGSYNGPLSPELKLVLRPNREVAAKSVDLYEIWGDDVVYDHVPVEIPYEVKSQASR